ncbi:MAG: hypothetical protein AB8H47_31290 [Bacteroidia bacterium]
MKSSIIIVSLLLLVSITSCDPFKPIYEDIEGQWEVANITIGERTSFNSAESLPDTSLTTLSQFDFAFCDQEGHAANSCDFSLTLADGQTRALIYHYVDADDQELVLGGAVRDIPDQENISGVYLVSMDGETMTLQSAPNSSPFLVAQYQGRSLTITLNRQ